ncbi:uncharacterized protein LOC144743076 [Ciona intestinalis]
MAMSKVDPPKSAVPGVSGSSTIGVQLKSEYSNCDLMVNEKGQYTLKLDGDVVLLTTAIFSKCDNLKSLFLAGGLFMATLYGLRKLRYVAGPFYKVAGGAKFVMTDEPDLIKDARKKLNNGSFSKALEEETLAIIKENPEEFSIQKFKIDSCQEIAVEQTTGDGAHISMKESNVEKSAICAHNINIGSKDESSKDSAASSVGGSRQQRLSKLTMDNSDIKRSAIDASNVNIQ